MSPRFMTRSAVAVPSRSSKPIGDRMILNVAFLADCDQVPAFDEAVKRDEPGVCAVGGRLALRSSPALHKLAPESSFCAAEVER